MNYLDKTLPLTQRKELFAQQINKQLNPIPEAEFNPDTFEPMGNEMAELSNRVRTLPPKVLPITHNLKPKPVREGQMIGMFESKQDLYLTFAHRCNDLQKQIDDLTTIVNNLINK